MSRPLRSLLAALTLVLAACGESQTPPPRPREPTGQAIGYYCRMTLTEHTGPKAQIFLPGEAEPLWFSSVRDGLIYTRLEGAGRKLLAFYVNDMAVGDWDHPAPGAWMEAAKAIFVIGSTKSGGGMGGGEVVPFSNPAAAAAFVARHGGRIVRIGDIDDAELFAAAPLRQ